MTLTYVSISSKEVIGEIQHVHVVLENHCQFSSVSPNVYNLSSFHIKIEPISPFPSHVVDVEV